MRAEHREGDEGLTYLWRCACGWASACTASASGRRERLRSGVIRRLSGGLRRQSGGE